MSRTQRGFRKYFVIDPRMTRCGPGKRLNPIQGGLMKHALAKEHVPPEIRVSRVLSKMKYGEQDNRETENQLQHPGCHFACSFLIRIRNTG